MSAVEGFVHLYHVWGALGALTALLFGMEAHKSWRLAGGTWRSAPSEWLGFAAFATRETISDAYRFAKWTVRSFFGLPFDWGHGEWNGRAYPKRQAILIGITLGGLSRFLTALYWAEKNRDWMAHVDTSVIMFASAVIMPAIIGDLLHHTTAWPEKGHRARLIGLAALCWVFVGLIGN